MPFFLLPKLKEGNDTMSNCNDERGCLTEMVVEYDLDKMYVWLVGEDYEKEPSVCVEFMSLKSFNSGKTYPLVNTEPGVQVVADDMLEIVRLAKRYAKKLDVFQKAA